MRQLFVPSGLLAVAMCMVAGQSCTSSGATGGADSGSGGDPSADGGDPGDGGSMGGVAGEAHAGIGADGGSPEGGSGPGVAGGSDGGTTNGGESAGGSSPGGSGNEGGNDDAGESGGGTGGRGGTGGSPIGGGGTGGLTGGTGGGGVTIASLVGKLDGHLVVLPCGEATTGDDCKSAGAIHNGVTQACGVMGASAFLEHVVEYPVRGETGRTYNVTMHFYGIMEPKNYGTSGITRIGGTTNTNIMTLMPVPWAQQTPPGSAFRPSNYDTYEIHVHNPAGAVVATYFINSDTGENHYTFAINYERTIPVIGGGKVRLRIFDANCRHIKNCTGGTSTPNGCAAVARTVDITAARPQPPAGALSQPALGRDPQNSGQWFLLDVTAVSTQ